MSCATDVAIRGDSIDLDQLLKLAGVVGSGGEAKHVIGEGLVQVNGAPEHRRRRQLTIGDIVAVADAGEFRIVSDGGEV